MWGCAVRVAVLSRSCCLSIVALSTVPTSPPRNTPGRVQGREHGNLGCLVYCKGAGHSEWRILGLGAPTARRI